MNVVFFVIVAVAFWVAAWKPLSGGHADVTPMHALSQAYDAGA